MIHWQINHVESIGSTNTELHKMASIGGASHGSLLIADVQTSGRGRMDRKWVSDIKGNLYFSFLLELQSDHIKYQLITMITAMSLVDAILEISPRGASSIGIKWPNDVLINNKKVAGILAESSSAFYKNGCPKFIVVGVGLNIVHKPLIENPVYAPTSLLDEGIITSSQECLNVFLSNFTNNYSKLLDKNHEFLVAEIQNRFCHMDSLVEISSHSELISGTFAGITENGEMILKGHQGKVEFINSGDVLRWNTAC